jgi:HK97 gp10 family phage protein
MMAADVIGARELVDAFGQLKSDMRDKSARRIVATGGGVLRKESRVVAQEHGLRKTGALINNIVIKRERDKPEGTEQYNLGVRHGRDMGNGKKITKYLSVGKSGRIVVRRENDPFYWKFLHFGTKHIQAVRFLEIALDNKAEAAIDAMAEKARKEVLKQA